MKAQPSVPKAPASAQPSGARRLSGNTACAPHHAQRSRKCAPALALHPSAQARRSRALKEGTCQAPRPHPTSPPMPQALAVDWLEVKTLALQIGVRESARQMGIPETTVKRRCTREGWLASRHAAKAALNALPDTRRALIAASSCPSAKMSNVSTAAEVLQRLGIDSRGKAAIAGNRAVTAFSEQSGVEIAERASDLYTVTKTLDLVHGWSEDKRQQTPLVSLTFHGSAPVLDLPSAHPEPVEQIEDRACE